MAQEIWREIGKWAYRAFGTLTAQLICARRSSYSWHYVNEKLNWTHRQCRFHLNAPIWWLFFFLHLNILFLLFLRWYFSYSLYIVWISISFDIGKRYANHDQDIKMFRFAIFCCRAFVDILPSETGIMSKNASFFTCAANQITTEASDYNKVHEPWCGTYNGDTNIGDTNNGSTNNDSTNIGGFDSVSTNSNSIDRDDKKINRSKSCTFNIRMFSLTAAQRKRNLCNSAERLRHAFIVNCIRSNCFENQMNFTAIYFARANIKRKSQQQQHFYSIWLNILCDGLSLLFASVFFLLSCAQLFCIMQIFKSIAEIWFQHSYFYCNSFAAVLCRFIFICKH